MFPSPIYTLVEAIKFQQFGINSGDQLIVACLDKPSEDDSLIFLLLQLNGSLINALGTPSVPEFYGVAIIYQNALLYMNNNIYLGSTLNGYWSILKLDTTLG